MPRPNLLRIMEAQREDWSSGNLRIHLPRRAVFLFSMPPIPRPILFWLRHYFPSYKVVFKVGIHFHKISFCKTSSSGTIIFGILKMRDSRQEGQTKWLKNESIMASKREMISFPSGQSFFAMIDNRKPKSSRPWITTKRHTKIINGK